MRIICLLVYEYLKLYGKSNYKMPSIVATWREWKALVVEDSEYET